MYVQFVAVIPNTHESCPALFITAWLSFLVSYNLLLFVLFLLLRNHPFSYPGHLYASLKLFVLVFTPVSRLGGAVSIHGRNPADINCVLCGLHSSITSAGAVCPAIARCVLLFGSV